MERRQNSTLHAVADVRVPLLAPGEGAVTAGRFAGRSFHFLVYLVPQNPQLCLTEGLTDADLYGEWSFE